MYNLTIKSGKMSVSFHTCSEIADTQAHSHSASFRAALGACRSSYFCENVCKSLNIPGTYFEIGVAVHGRTHIIVWVLDV